MAEKFKIGQMLLTYLKCYISNVECALKREVEQAEWQSWQNEDLRSVRKPEAKNTSLYMQMQQEGFVNAALYLFQKHKLTIAMKK